MPVATTAAIECGTSLATLATAVLAAVVARSLWRDGRRTRAAVAVFVGLNVRRLRWELGSERGAGGPRL